jgi:hypothetical protein
MEPIAKGFMAFGTNAPPKLEEPRNKRFRNKNPRNKELRNKELRNKKLRKGCPEDRKPKNDV